MKALLFALILTSCALPVPECTGSGTCGEGQMCREYRCYRVCEDRDDCLEGESCRVAHVPDGIGFAGWNGAVCVSPDEMGEW